MRRVSGPTFVQETFSMVYRGAIDGVGVWQAAASSFGPKIDQYIKPASTVTGAAENPPVLQTPPAHSDLATILKAIQDSREVVETKEDKVQVDVSLLHQNLRNITCQVTEAEI
ncbi:hypothetical protein NDU88_002544 [Pleurodeles waltl]|uniref:Uncharacterized protein n=1 Tax=Pleurodeles waltl TaxID=8319 RepID=A0AAV7W3M2_PLEWA|nr:hypothetical protein NDU88_002544 [Pleurodeles waltl]